MKRSGPLRRKTPLKPGGPLKRTQLKRTRPKTSPEREKYRRLFKTCQCCHEKPTEHIHEIVTRAKSAESIEHRCCFLALCGACHSRMHDHSDFPLARQYALKRRVDPEHYDREKLNLLRGRDKNAITEEEVNDWYVADATRFVPERASVPSVGREPHRPGRSASNQRRHPQPSREVSGRGDAAHCPMSKADDLRATIRALEIKAGVQRGHLHRTETELASAKRRLAQLEGKGKRRVTTDR